MAEEGVPPEPGAVEDVGKLVADAQADGTEAALFDALDANGDGQVTKEELIAGMAARGKQLTEAEAAAIVAAADKDGDGRIDRAEFTQMGRSAPLQGRSWAPWHASGGSRSVRRRHCKNKYRP